MAYMIHVEIETPAGSAPLDVLQCEGAASLLHKQMAGIECIEGGDEDEGDAQDEGMWVGVECCRVAVYPTGALLWIRAAAPTLEIAEEAVRQVVAQVIEETEPLAEWNVVKSSVELDERLALDALAAAHGPDAPPADLHERAAVFAAARESSDTGMSAEQRERSRAKIERCAPRLTALSLADFGLLEDDGTADGDEEFGVPPQQARLAAGALVYAIEILIDGLFQDIAALARQRKAADEVDGCFILDGLPPGCAEQYTGLFAKRFLVTAVTLTARLTGPRWAPPACVAEELALRLLIEQAEMVLDLYDLADEPTGRALEAFRDAVFEDFDHEELYDEQDDDATARFDASAWFAPFDATRYTHPYAYDREQDLLPS